MLQRIRLSLARISSRQISYSRPRPNAVSPRPTLPVEPPNQPRTDFAGDAIDTISGVGRAIRYLIFFTVATVTAGGIGYEGLHQYIERVLMPSGGTDEWGWEDEVQGWTGGVKGGTDPRLGFKGRHAVRSAWICQNWGAGTTSSIDGHGVFGNDFLSARAMIGSQYTPIKADRGYEQADDYLDLAIVKAKERGLVFPRELDVTRGLGPASSPPADPAAMDLLLLKAGVLERIGTGESVNHAKELYEQVFAAVNSDSSPLQEAKVMRLAGKVGSLCARLGDNKEAMEWWRWGLGRVGIQLPESAKKGWFKTETEPRPTISALPPPVLRAAITLLISTSTHLAQNKHTTEAAALQTTALTLLPPPTSIPTPTTSNAAQTLHETWLQQRSSLLTLHLASVHYAQGKPALNLATTAASRAENVVTALTPIPRAYAKLPAKLLLRDSLLTAAEAAFTRGLLLERSAPPQLELAAELFEHAMTLSAEESGRTDDEDQTGDWRKYYRSFARVKEKLNQ